ncbi:MAG: NADH-quinone oxidoreductase subunit N, partial [Chloroflexota bacterium]
VFGAVVDANMTWLAVIAVITSVISGYYYLRLVFYSFMFDGEGEVAVKPAIAVAVALAVIVTFLLGVYPGPFFDAAREAVFSGAQMLAGG